MSAKYNFGYNMRMVRHFVILIRDHFSFPYLLSFELPFNCRPLVNGITCVESRSPYTALARDVSISIYIYDKDRLFLKKN